MNLSKCDLEKLLEELEIPFNEGMTPSKNANTYPRIDYWEYVWEDVVASGEEFIELDTYQVSFYAKKPREAKLLLLRDKLRFLGIHPQFYHEYVKEDKVFHTYFSLEVYV